MGPFSRRAARRVLLTAPLLFLGGCLGRPFVVLALLGDVMLGRGVAQAHLRTGCQGAMAYLTPWLQSADLAMANLESPLTQAPLVATTAYDLRAPPGSGACLRTAGLSLVSLANNHAWDSGEAGLAETRAAVRRSGLTPVGPEPRAVLVPNGALRLAVLALDDVTAPLDIGQARHEIRAACAQGAAVVVSIHWGEEYQPAPDERQMLLAQAFADSGASLVWGHHPHVLQPVAWVQGRGQASRTLVVYSLGNALFDQAASPDTRRSAVLRVWLSWRGVTRVEALPFAVDPTQGQAEALGSSGSAQVLSRLGSLAQPSGPWGPR